ncbi:MAG TPA: hypothetical protein VFV23_12025 [Verrucomicrobiae bacterium]|nr:hypothetical protein [Verrucomicrobiae bacterium]
MTTLSKTLLAGAVVGLFGGSVIDFGDFNLAPGWTAVLPLGAIALGMFLIVLALEKEVSKFDAEEAEKMQKFAHAFSNPKSQHDQ